MLVTWKLVLFGSRPNRFMALTTRWSRTASTPSGKVGSEMNAAGQDVTDQIQISQP